MTTEHFLQQISKRQATRVLSKLETDNLIKNAFLLEVSEALKGCYSDDLKVKNERIESLLDIVSTQIDGITQNSLELSNVSFTINNVCDLIERIEV